MDYFTYQNGELYAENVPIKQIAADFGTPAYVYSQATILRHLEVFDQALNALSHRIFYSVKANSNQAILSLLVKNGAGMDVVSIGEYRRAIAAGASGEDIVFSGVGKTAQELRYTLENGIYQYNIESQNELALLNEIAISMGVQAPIAFRINPDVDAQTHEKISTGRADDKFGIPYHQAHEFYRNADQMKGIRVVGVDMHIGSQITKLEPFERAFSKLRALIKSLRSDGINIQRADLGGGLGIPYQVSNQLPPLPMDYGRLIEQQFGDLDLEIGIEPGRLLLGNSGLLISSVIYLKRAIERNFLIIDAAMNDLLRPAMYDAHHDIVPVRQGSMDRLKVDVVGAICESSDCFARERELPIFEPGGLLAIRTAGAYGAVMASEYNSRPMIPEILVNGDDVALIRPRGDIQAMIDRDIVPDWI